MNSKIKCSWFKFFELILFKINHSFVTIFLFLFSLLLSLFTPLILFSLKLSVDSFITIFQYYIMIFYSIILFIFVLMNGIKIFGTQIEDSSFLLLLTKPYSRKNIIVTQYIALFFMNFIFILLNVLILIVSGGISGFTFNNLYYLKFYVITILKLFVFAFLFSILVIVGVVTLLALIRSQSVFLIFIIFCSLFLLGGLPYSLTNVKTDNIILSFKNQESYSVRQIKNSILFRENLKKNLIKYPNLTNAIFDFYCKLDASELNDVNNKNVINKRIDFFKDLGLIDKNPVVKNFEGNALVWKPVKYQNNTIIIQITFNSYFQDLNFLKSHLSNNKIFQDLLKIINNYESECKSINTFMITQKSKAPTLLTYDNDISKTFIKIKGQTNEKLNSNEIKDIFFSDYEYQFNFRHEFNDMFYNPVYYVIRTVEDYICTQVKTYSNVTNNDLTLNKNYKQYINPVNTYQILNKINIIEHWNQLWTYFMGYYGDFWFDTYALSNIDFDSQKNNLFSYHDFKLTLLNNKINTNKVEYFQNISVTIYVYIAISVILFYLSYVMFLKKNIS